MVSDRDTMQKKRYEDRREILERTDSGRRSVQRLSKNGVSTRNSTSRHERRLAVLLGVGGTTNVPSAASRTVDAVVSVALSATSAPASAYSSVVERDESDLVFWWLNPSILENLEDRVLSATISWSVTGGKDR